MNEVLFIFWTKKSVKVKPIKSLKSREIYQAEIVLLPIFIWDWFKYIFTIMDNFTKYGCVIPLNGKQNWEDLNSLNKCPSIHNIPDWHQTDKWREFKKKCSWKIYESKGIARIYEAYYTPQRQEAVKVSNRNVQNFLTSAKDHKKKNII